LYEFGESTGGNSPILQNEFFFKDATKDLCEEGPENMIYLKAENWILEK